ncbi:MAG: ATP-binding protein [Clostridiales bacterium]|nr:ATP-binding protein [Clostridiales bacterium]
MSHYKIYNQENIKKIIFEIIKDIKKEIILTDELTFNIRLVLSELLRNSIEHNNSKEDVDITYEINQEHHRIYFKVEDSGSGFDYNIVQSKKIKKDVFDNRGRGLVIVHGLCDRVEYNEQGNSVAFTMTL